jgi:hypothetical protein
MRVVCINDQGLPDNIPVEKRIVKGEIYTAVKAVQLQIGNKLAFELLEKPLGEDTFPYEYWSAERFVPEEHYNEQQKYEKVNFDIPLGIE